MLMEWAYETQLLSSGKRTKQDYDKWRYSYSNKCLLKKAEKPKEWTFERIYDIIKCKEKTGKQEKGVHEDV